MTGRKTTGAKGKTGGIGGGHRLRPRRRSGGTSSRVAEIEQGRRRSTISRIRRGVRSGRGSKRELILAVSAGLISSSSNCDSAIPLGGNVARGFCIAGVRDLSRDLFKDLMGLWALYYTTRAYIVIEYYARAFTFCLILYLPGCYTEKHGFYRTFNPRQTVTRNNCTPLFLRNNSLLAPKESLICR